MWVDIDSVELSLTRERAVAPQAALGNAVVAHANHPGAVLVGFVKLWLEAAHYGGRVDTDSANRSLTGQPNRFSASRRALDTILSRSGGWPSTYDAMLDAYQEQE